MKKRRKGKNRAIVLLVSKIKPNHIRDYFLLFVFVIKTN